MIISKLKFKHLINPYKWWMFMRGTYYAWLWKVTDCRSIVCLEANLKDTPEYFRVQVIKRAESCMSCLHLGNCLKCGCTTPANFLNPTDKCSGGSWGPMDNETIYNLKK